MMYVGIDLGTSSVKILLMSKDGGIVDEVTEEYPVYYPKAGWAEQNPEDWWQGTLNALKNLVSRNTEVKDHIKAIGFSGQMHGMVALDNMGNVLTPSIIWCDQRTTEECHEITEHFGAKGLSDLVGNMALTGFTAPKILWLKKNAPEIFEKVDMFLLPKDFISFKLSGNYVTDYSDASGMLLLDVANKCYSQPVLDFIGITESQLPNLHESFEVTGQLSEAIKAELGLSHEVLIVGGAGDQAAGAIGTGTVSEGVVSVTLGTSGVVFAAHDDYRVDSENRMHAFCHASGRYHSMGVMLSAANCLKWWSEQASVAEIDDLLNEVDDTISEVVFLPYLMGERTPYPDPNARGTFVGMDMNTNRKDLTKSLLEGVAFGLKDSLDILVDMGVPVEELRVIGGGARSIKWRQIIADIFGQKIVGINTNQGGALGAAILAAVGDGAFESVDAATKAIIKTVDAVEPNLANHEIYKEKHLKYKALYQSLKPYFEM
ncbi:MAG: xylulokinase [Clostridiales bacterium 38-18]|nr:MAG: xylulokinase [Clostridiales bacterium 38-18]